MDTEKTNKKIIEESIIDDSWMDVVLEDKSKDHYLEYSSAIATEILLQLKKQGLSQTALAKELGVKPQQVSKIVKGKENLTLDTIGKIEKALNFRMLHIIDNEREEIERNKKIEKNNKLTRYKEIYNSLNDCIEKGKFSESIFSIYSKSLYQNKREKQINLLPLSNADFYNYQKEPEKMEVTFITLITYTQSIQNVKGFYNPLNLSSPIHPNTPSENWEEVEDFVLTEI